MKAQKTKIALFCIIILSLIINTYSITEYSVSLYKNGNEWDWQQASMLCGSSYYLGAGTDVRTYKVYDISDYSNDAQIDSIRVTFTLSNSIGTSEVKVYFVGMEDFSSGYLDDWDAIENGTKYDSITVGSSSEPYSRTFFAGSDFVSDFSDTLTGSDDFDIAFFSPEAENSATTRTISVQNKQVILTLYGEDIGTYTNILFKNVNESEANIGDTLKVNNSVNVLSGNSLSLEDGIEHNVKVKNQLVNYFSDDYQHHDWNNDDYYLLSKSFYTYNGNQTGFFKEIEQISINSNQSVSLSIKDPWYVDPSSGQQEDEYHTLSGANYDVFINENSSFISSQPIYQLNAPAIGPVTTSNIYIFDKWTGTDVDFGSGDTTTTNCETDVVFTSANASVTAQYVSAISNGLTVNVSSGETLTIPPNSTYNITPGNFKINVLGELKINEATSQPVVFQSNAGTPSNSDWDGIHVTSAGSAVLRYVTIKNAETPISIFTSDYTHSIGIENCTVENCLEGIKSYCNSYETDTDLFSAIHVENCIINNIGDSNHQNYAISVDGNYKTVTIRKNEIYDCYNGIYNRFECTQQQVNYNIPSYIKICNNVIHDLINYDDVAYGIRILDYSLPDRSTLPYGYIYNNTIDDFEGYGIYTDFHADRQTDVWQV